MILLCRFAIIKSLRRCSHMIKNWALGNWLVVAASRGHVISIYNFTLAASQNKVNEGTGFVKQPFYCGDLVNDHVKNVVKLGTTHLATPTLSNRSCSPNCGCILRTTSITLAVKPGVEL